ncbi:MAG: phosphotransferase [Planctomycetes bacterium]|nr:phosphotransferase [Planctomycetota bacterium]
MQLLDETNAEEYLRTKGHLGSGETVGVRELVGGVSNVVLHVARTEGESFILKQAREQLRVADVWTCSVERIWREVEVLDECAKLTKVDGKSSLRAETPRLLFEDRDNYLYAMTAAPSDHVVWKDELLAGRARAEVAAACGELLGRLHSGSWHEEKLARQLDDRQFFDELRIDPFYRQIACEHPDLEPAITRLIDSVLRERHCLVHGDFSPKNLLLSEQSLMLIDFEVGHYGDPAFDLGFFLSHLMLKAFCFAPLHEPYFELTKNFWTHYRAQMLSVISAAEYDALVQRAIQNTAGCALARLDGKSKIDYLEEPRASKFVSYVARCLPSRQHTGKTSCRRPM